MRNPTAYSIMPWERVLFVARPEGLPCLRSFFSGWRRAIGWVGVGLGSVMLFYSPSNAACPGWGSRA